ncbi:MAG: dipicolinate synthase subunit DpsA [Oscillospiraceae bacterium]|nr:dipicolinate synthase subunit DpsA [Oscillospiraceae bacterium]
MNFAVIGGDMRQVKLAELLAEDGHNVAAFAVDKEYMGAGAVTRKGSLELAGTDCVILPLPVMGKEGLLSTPLSSESLTIQDTLFNLPPEAIICAGKIDPATRELARHRKLELIDYLEREEFAVANAVSAAEGALMLIMSETAVTVHNLKILVTGFGRIGKILCHRLWGLGAEVSAYARECADLAWIKAYGYHPVDPGVLDDSLHEFDVVVNTVPARIFGESRLKKLNPGVWCLDLASKPGGIDFIKAAELGVPVLWALGLPGEIAPVTSGAVIRDTIYNILKEEGAM